MTHSVRPPLVGGPRANVAAEDASVRPPLVGGPRMPLSGALSCVDDAIVPPHLVCGVGAAMARAVSRPASSLPGAA